MRKSRKKVEQLPEENNQVVEAPEFVSPYADLPEITIICKSFTVGSPRCTVDLNTGIPEERSKSLGTLVKARKQYSRDLLRVHLIAGDKKDTCIVRIVNYSQWKAVLFHDQPALLHAL